MQELVDYFDDIPNMMSALNKVESPSRFKAESNSSYNVGFALRGNDGIGAAPKVSADNLSRKQCSGVIGRASVEDTSHIVLSKLSALQNKGVDVGSYYSPYDVNRTGKVSYKDFSDTLLSMSSGLSRDEAHLLAARMDAHKVGSVSYRSIMTSLKEIASSTPPSSPSKQQQLPVKFSAKSKTESEFSNQYTAPINRNYAPRSSANEHSIENHNHVGGDVNYSHSDNHQPNHFTNSASLEAKSSDPPLYTLDPQTVVSVQSLSADREAVPFGKHSTYKGAQVGRRFYHNTAAHMFVTETPYYLEPSVEEKRLERKRSSSAPSRARRSSSNTEVANIHSLRTSLERVAFNNAQRNANIRPESNEEANVPPHVESLLRLQKERNAARQRKQQIESINSIVLENTVVDQLGGRLNQLRHTLSQQDLSRSGAVNREEFQTGLKKCGVSLAPQQVDTLYQQLASENASTAVMGYSQNRALNIESFVNRMQMRTVAPALVHVADERVSDGDDAHSVSSYSVAKSVSSKSSGYSEQFQSKKSRVVADDRSIAQRAREKEELRVVKKVLHSTNKASDPHRIFSHIDKNHVGWIDANQLRDSLDRLNANLSDTEFGVLLQRIDKTADGKIDLSKFEKVLHETVTDYDNSETRQRQLQLRETKRYNPTFQSSETLCVYDAPEFDRLADSATYRQERMRWSKLQAAFQANQKQVLAAFAEKSVDKDSTKHRKTDAANVEANALHELSVAELHKKLQGAGLPLGGEDVNILRQHLEQRDGSDRSKVSLEGLCELVGIQCRVDDKNIIELHNPREAQLDGGTFAASRRSQLANPTQSTSMFVGDDRDSTRSVTGERRGKVAQPRYAHTSDPSRFWELTQTSEQAILYPHPIHSLREPWPSQTKPSLDSSAASRGIVRINTQHSDSDHVRGALRMEGGSGDKRNRRRASSAPPRSRSSPTDHFSGGSDSKSTSKSAAVQATVNHIAKWASSSLAEYFDAKTGSAQTTPSTTAAPVNRERLNSNPAVHTGSSSPQREVLTLRRQFAPSHTPQQAPYATYE